MATRQDYITYAIKEARAAGVDPDIFVRQIDMESGFNPRALSPAGAIGIAQFMPATAAGLGIDPWDPWQSLRGAARLMRSYLDRYAWSYELALAAYNAGPGAVAKYGGVPPYPETQKYIRAILGSGGSVSPPASGAMDNVGAIITLAAVGVLLFVVS